ncbi:MAG: putative sugar nucleotidyl transferase [Planctomycetaceae bacterium]
MRVVFFEDEQATQFAPIALTRPVFDLLCGCFSTRDRVLKSLMPKQWGGLVRTELRDVCREENPAALINDCIALRDGQTLLVNGRWLGEPNNLALATPDNVGLIDDQIAWLLIDEAEALLLDEDNWCEAIPRIARARSEHIAADGMMLQRPWDLISNNANQIREDFNRAFDQQSNLPEHVVLLGDPAMLSVDATAQIDPYVVLDVRTGPIRIEADTRIQSFTRIEGPSFIGAETQIFRALVREGTSIGPVCRVGGEIEESIFQGYANKYHEGFLGHSFVCPWVNIGAMTTTSDLKNDYSSVKVPQEGTPIDTGSSKVGSFIGDHAKTAINSMFNTGSSIGVMAMVLPGGPLLPKFIPSFGVVWFGEVRESAGLEGSLDVARTAVSRRGLELTNAQEKLIRHLYTATADSRAHAVRRAADRKAAAAGVPRQS